MARGHLLPRWFGGRGTGDWKENAVTLYKSTNQEMLRYERQVENTIRERGDFTEVWYRVTPAYYSDQPIPDHIEIEAVGKTNNGFEELINVIIPNMP